MRFATDHYRDIEGYVRLNYHHRVDGDGELEAGVLDWMHRGSQYADVPMLPHGEDPPELMDFVGEAFPDGSLALANLERLLEDWSDPGFLLVPESEAFQDLDAYIAERYPDGRPYHLGGPWDGKTELPLDQGIYEGGDWLIAADEERRVRGIELMASAVDRLFNTGDTDAQAFAVEFSRAYGVPLEFYASSVPPELLMLVGTALHTGWAYANRDAGWAVTLTEHKLLRILRVTPTSEQSFD